MAIKLLNYRLHHMFDGEEIRTESEQQEVRSGESITERDDVVQAEAGDNARQPGAGEVIEMDVMNSCSQDVPNKSGEDSIMQPATTVATATTSALSMPSTYPSSLLTRSSSVAAPASIHKVLSFATFKSYFSFYVTAL